MSVFSIYDGRTSFWQWDLNQKLVVSDAVCGEVHFCNETDDCALVCKVYMQDDKRLVNVPNVLLQNAAPLRVFAYTDDHTTHSEIFTVISRTKPDDYVYTETEVWTAERAVEKALQEAKDSGEFKGDPGPKGDPGVVKFKVVNELPQEDIEDAIYLVPVTEGAEDNLFNEYIFVDGKWEKIGSAAVAVDMTGYVKDTDYAAQHKAGVVKVWHNYHGLKISPEGILTVAQATENEIDKKTDFRILSAKNLDYAMKVGMTTNTIALTDEEKAAAQEWLGVTEQIGNIETALDGIIAIQNELIGGAGA